jgi:hypothetical protein
MYTRERILDIVTAPAGLFNVYLTDAEPWYYLSPVAVFANMAFYKPIEDSSSNEQEDMSYIGLDGVHSITCPHPEISGYFGAVHSSEITKPVRCAWGFEAQFRKSNQSLDLMCVEDCHTRETFAGEPVRLDGILGHRGFVEATVKTVSRVPATPGWFNVYLLERSPWYFLRPVVVWNLERRRSPSGFFWNLLGKRYPDWFIWGRYGQASVVGIDGSLGQPGSAFLEMTHESVITSKGQSVWESLAREQCKSGG